MKVKNIGGKVISIGTTAILPDETTQVSDSYADNPAFTCLVKHGNLAVIKETAGGKGKKGGEGKKGGKADTTDKGDDSQGDGGKADSGGKDNNGGQA